MVHVQIGPLPSAGVLSWIGYARGVLAELRAGTGPADRAPDDTALETFEDFLGEWERAARRSEVFAWETEIDPEHAEFLAHAFLGVARALADAADRRGYSVAPQEGEEFYQALVTNFLDAFEQESNSSAAFAEDVRDAWPGLEER
jgi:hypothetical protein